MKKVLFVLLVMLLSVSLFACSELVAPDTLAPVTTAKPKQTLAPQTSDVTTVDTGSAVTQAPVVIVDDGSKYHLETLKKDNVQDENGFVYDVFENGAALVGYTGKLTELTVPSSFDGKAVTLIDDYAFKALTKITKVTLPESVIRIGNNAFYSCRALKEIGVPSSVTAFGNGVFEYCESLESFTFTDGVNELGARTFYHCSSLKSATLPVGLTTVPSETFCHCVSLESYTLNEGITSIGDYAFAFCKDLTNVTIPTSVENIGTYAFYNCAKITKAEFSDKIKKVSDYSFYGCSQISVLNLNKVETLGAYAFYGCSALDTITVPSTVKEIGNGCFAYCTAVKKIDLPFAIKKIAPVLFRGCTSLEEVGYAEDILSIGKNAFAESGIKSIDIPATLTEIGQNAFTGCTQLKAITFGNEYTDYTVYTTDIAKANELLAGFTGKIGSVTTKKERKVDAEGNLVLDENQKPVEINVSCIVYHGISEDDFASIIKTLEDNNVLINKDLAKIETKTAALKEISNRAFENCTGIEKITLPDNIVTIGSNAFTGCTALSDVKFGKNIGSIGKEAFLNCTAIKSVYLPDSAKPAKNAFGMYDVTTINESTGKEVITKTPVEGFILIGFTGSDVHAYATSHSVAFESAGILGCIPYADFTVEQIDNDGTKSYKITGYSGNSTKLGIPSKYKDGLFITAIDADVFAGITEATEITIPDSIVSIGDNAFANCSSVTTIKFPSKSNKIEIGKGAFAGTKPTEAKLPEGLVAIEDELFKGCDTLAKVTIPSTITKLGQSAFEGTAITTAKLPATVTSIGKNVFKGTPLTELTIPFAGSSASDAQKLSYLFGDVVCETLTKLEIGILDAPKTEDVKIDIAESAFEGFTALKTVVLGSNVKSIGDRAFANCSSLEGYIELKGPAPTIAEGATHILDGTPNKIYFKYPSNDAEPFLMKSSYENIIDKSTGFWLWHGYKIATSTASTLYEGEITAVDGSTKIAVKISYTGKITFKGSGAIPDYTLENLPVWASVADMLTSVSFTDVTGIGAYALYGTMLDTIEIPATVDGIGEYAFYGAPCAKKLSVKGKGNIGAHAFEGCKDSKLIEIGANIKSIGEAAFKGCALAAEIKISGETEIGKEAFAGCTALTKLTISKVKVIGDSAFEQSALTALTVPDSVTTIGSKAFANSASLAKVAIKEGVTVAPDAFENTPYATAQ